MMENGIHPAPEASGAQPAPVKPKREYTRRERLLLPCALLLGILLDRLFNAGLRTEKIVMYWSIFWLCYLVVLTVFSWAKLKKDGLLWGIAACAAALCVWSILFEGGNHEYAGLTFLVIPNVLMMHAALLAGPYTLKDVLNIAAAWLAGWFVKPFSGLAVFGGSMGSLLGGPRRQTVKKIALGVGITLPLLCILVPLLGGADRVFQYYVERVTGSWDLESFSGHMMVILIVFALFYSFLWNICLNVKRSHFTAPKGTMDLTICAIVLGSVTILYLLFCGVQFTYLFARAGLPGGMTYSEYAREGFAATVTVCTINLALFGAFLRFGAQKKPVKGLLAGLLGLTGVMLASGFIRLGLYIGAYGLTWLRLLSGWFMLYLAVVILLCAVRLFCEKLPVMAVCAALLLIWYVALGYANPSKLAADYNAQQYSDLAQS